MEIEKYNETKVIISAEDLNKLIEDNINLGNLVVSLKEVINIIVS